MTETITNHATPADEQAAARTTDLPVLTGDLAPLLVAQVRRLHRSGRPHVSGAGRQRVLERRRRTAC
jgi:hypothetical protein